MNLDKKIKEDNGAQIVKYIIQKMFDITLFDFGVTRYYIDLNSCISIMFRYNLDDSSIKEVVSDYIEKFIIECELNNTQMIFLWTLENSYLHQSIYPEWKKERGERVDISKSDFLKRLLVTLNKYASKPGSFIKILYIKDIHPSVIVRHIESQNKAKCVVLSKDTVFQCLNMNNCIIFNGRYFCDFNDRFRQLPDDITLKNPEMMLKYYLALKGDSYNEFKGAKGIGPVKALDIVNLKRCELEMGIEINVSGLDEGFDLYQYSHLFDVEWLYKHTERDLDSLIYNKTR